MEIQPKKVRVFLFQGGISRGNFAGFWRFLWLFSIGKRLDRRAHDFFQFIKRLLFPAGLCGNAVNHIRREEKQRAEYQEQKAGIG